MAARLSLLRRLVMVAAITLILAVFSALVLAVWIALQETVASNVKIWPNVATAALVFSGFTLIIIAACIPVIVLPAILIGRRMGWLHSLESTLTLTIPVGIGCALITTGGFLGKGTSWLLLIALGSGCGLIFGMLWWRWIGVHEAAENSRQVLPA